MTHYDAFRKIVLGKTLIFARLLHTFPQRLIDFKKARSKRSLHRDAARVTKKLAHTRPLNDASRCKSRGGAAW
jgi:hypothetical protein